MLFRYFHILLLFTASTTLQCASPPVPITTPGLILVMSGQQFPEGPAYDGKGDIYVSNCNADYVTNGLAFSADGKTLYLCEDGLNRIDKFRVHGDGSLGLASIFSVLDSNEPGHPDGMAIDRAGHIWIAHYGRLHVLELDNRG